MKRSTCLSAFLVALSVTSIASAAPTQNQAPKLVAQAATNVGSDVAQQGGDGTGTGTGTGTPSTGTADGSTTGENATQPAVSIGTSPTAPATDTSQSTATEPAKKTPKPRPFAGTQLYNQNSMTTGTVFRGQQQDANPTVESNLWLLPRYAINQDFQLRGRAIITYEYTNSDSTTYRNEPLLSDVGVQLFYRSIPAFLGIKPQIALTLTAPTSKASRARTMIVTPGVIAQLSRPIEHVLGGEMLLLASLSYSRPFYSQRQPGVVDSRDIQTFTCVSGGACGDILSGQMNASDTIAYMFLIEQEWGKFSPALLYFGGTQWVYQPKQDVTESQVVAGGNNIPVTSGQPGGGVVTRQTHYFNAFLDYNFNPWFTGEVGYWNSTSAINENGTYANPFFNRYADTRVYLGCNINIDNLLKALEGGEADSGIVRAKNKHTPMFTF
jgi:hypothetical protein